MVDPRRRGRGRGTGGGRAVVLSFRGAEEKFWSKLIDGESAKEIFDWPRAQKRIGPNLLRRWRPPPPPPTTQYC